MKMLANAVGIALALSSALAFADNEWLPLAESDVFLWEGHAGTRHQTVTKGGSQVIAAEGRVRDKATKRITFEQWYVSVQDCQSHSGKVVTLDMSGTFKGETDFILNGGSVASSLAEMLCYPVLEDQKKGI